MTTDLSYDQVKAILDLTMEAGVTRPDATTKTWTYKVEMDPCGECRKGECDHCEFCEWTAGL